MRRPFLSLCGLLLLLPGRLVAGEELDSLLDGIDAFLRDTVWEGEVEYRAIQARPGHLRQLVAQPVVCGVVVCARMPGRYHIESWYLDGRANGAQRAYATGQQSLGHERDQVVCFEEFQQHQETRYR